jgi:hypothetical protein
MARYAGGARTTNAPTATLPGLSLYSIASIELFVVQVEVYNTTTTACAVSLAAFTSAGTPGTGLTEAKHNPNTPTPNGTLFQSHTSTPPTLAFDALESAEVGAAIGAGVIWTFHDKPIIVQPGTANGIGILCPVGTGQICRVHFIWDE